MELAGNSDLLGDWRVWLRTLFPQYLRDATGREIPFAPHHELLWDWVWALVPGRRPPPFVAVWPRGAAKSTSAELACVALAARQVRRYGLYLSNTQDQSDDHVQNVATMFESSALAKHFPAAGERLVGKYGHSRGWRRERLRTVTFTLDAIGLDTAARGAKMEDQRPDFIVIDDVDHEHDTESIIQRKIVTLTKGVLPAGSEDVAVLAVQNLVHPRSIFARLTTDDPELRANFLTNRFVSGPVPALRNMAYEENADGRVVIVSGEPTWAGQGLARCQAIVDDIGITAFREECQHEVDDPPGGMFDHLVYRHCAWAELPDLVRIAVWVDPAVTATDASDSHGIQADGLGPDGKVYRLWSWERRTTPEDSLERAIIKAIELGADHVGVETDQGGDTWESVYREAVRAVRGHMACYALALVDGSVETAVSWLAEHHGELAGSTVPQGLQDEWPWPADAVHRVGLAVRVPRFESGKAGAGHGPKTHRAGLMLASYERGGFVHVLGTHDVLERALRRFPRKKPLDLVDTAYWSWIALTAARKVGALVVPTSASGGWSSAGRRTTAG